MSLATPVQIRELQIKLYQKAKKEPDFRFEEAAQGVLARHAPVLQGAGVRGSRGILPAGVGLCGFVSL